MKYWLFKTEPDVYSIDHLAAEKCGYGVWDGIRNYQARNLLRDEVKVGDKVMIYHSSCKNIGIAGIGNIVRSSYPDPAQFNPESPYFDAKASTDNPRWYCVDVSFIEKFDEVIPLKTLKAMPQLAEMILIRQGRLSVQPVTVTEWKTIEKLK